MPRARFHLSAAALCALVTAIPVAKAQNVLNIAAIVNDEVISAYDLEARMRLVLFSTRLADTPDVRRRIQGQILRTLIDERIQMQEAKRRNVSVSRRDIRRAKANIEEQNRLQSGTLEGFLAQNNIPLDAMLSQLRANIAWNKLLVRRLRPRITIGEDEIDEVIERVKSRQGQTEYRIAEILLAVDSPDQETSVRSTAQRITDQVSKGARFSAIARQFSQSATAAVGGDLGWVHESELGPTLNDILPKMSKGSMTSPIKTVSGYRIIQLRDSRKIAQAKVSELRVGLRQLFLPLPGKAGKSDIESQLDLARTLRGSVGNCTDFEKLAREVNSPRSPDLGKMTLNSLAPAIRTVVGNVPAGGVTEPISLPDGILLLMVCSREGGAVEIKLPDRNTVADRLMRQRLSLMARRYLRDLRLSAVVDLRI